MAVRAKRQSGPPINVNSGEEISYLCNDSPSSTTAGPSHWAAVCEAELTRTKVMMSSKPKSHAFCDSCTLASASIFPSPVQICCMQQGDGSLRSTLIATTLLSTGHPQSHMRQPHLVLGRNYPLHQLGFQSQRLVPVHTACTCAAIKLLTLKPHADVQTCPAGQERCLTFFEAQSCELDSWKRR